MRMLIISDYDNGCVQTVNVYENGKLLDTNSRIEDDVLVTKKGNIVLTDKVPKEIKDIEEREKFLNWLCDLEFNLYELPEPTKVFFLNMPIEKSMELMKNRKNKFIEENIERKNLMI